MAQIINFTGNERESVSFSSKLDGSSYQCQIKYNFVGERWYFCVKNQSGNILLNIALVGSVEGKEINLLQGVFSRSSIVWYQKNGQIEVNP